MDKSGTSFKFALPSITNSLAAGFNLVAENIYLIILPVLIDLMIWLGPKIRVYDLLKDSVVRMLNEVSKTAPAALVGQMKALNDLTLVSLEQTNIFGAIGLSPISVPSLLSGSGTAASPLANPKIIELNSVMLLLVLIAGLFVIGMIAGCFYFSIVAQKTSVQPFRLTIQRFLLQLLNMFLTILIIFFALIILMIPISCVTTIFTLISPGLAQIVLFIILIMIAWLIVPIFFSIHGVFLGSGVLDSFKLSFNLSKWFSSPTSFFIVAVVIISQGLNLIWTIPAANSWLLLIGVFGQAFISTSLIAASFILYQKYVVWIIDNEELITKGIIRK